jgi:hypothetical protein
MSFGLQNEKRLPNQVWEPFFSKIDYADGGTRTRTALSGQRILSPLRLPFRHIGARAEANEAAHRWTGKRNFAQRNQTGAIFGATRLRSIGLTPSALSAFVRVS